MNSEDLLLWVKYGLELTPGLELGLFSLPTRLHACERILAEGNYATKFSELRSSKGAEVVQQVLETLKRKGAATLEDFRDEMENSIRNLENQQVHKYLVAFPLAFNFPVEIQSNIRDSYTIDGRTVLLRNFASFYSSTLSSLDSAAKRKIGLPLRADDWRWSALAMGAKLQVVEAYARDPFYALLDALKPASRWVSTLSWSETSRVQMKFPLLPFSKIKMPQFGMVFDEQNTFIDSFGGEYPVSSDPFSPIQDLKTFNQVLDRLEALPRSTLLATVIQALEVYTDAVSDGEGNSAFVKFWLGLELMARLRRRISDQAVAQRVKRTFKKKPTMFDSQVDALLEKRNALMHEGRLDVIEWQDLIFAKFLYELLLGLLIRFCRDGHDVEWVQTFYDYTGAQKSRLEEAKNALEYLLGKDRSAS